MSSYNLRKIKVVYLKELYDILRDRKTIFTMIVLPLILYPVLIIFMSQITVSQLEKLRKRTFKMAIRHETYAPELTAKLKNDKSVELVAIDGDIKKAVLDRKIQIAIVLPENFQKMIKSEKTAKMEIVADLSDEKSDLAKDKVEKIINEFKGDLTKERLKGKGLETELIKPIETSITNLASAKKMGGRVLGPVLSYLFIIILMMSAMYPAIDLTAGEKERSTIETLLVTPLSRLEMVIGKYLTVLTISLASGLVNVGSMALTFSRALPISERAIAKINLTPSFEALIIMLPFIILLAAFFSAIAIAIATQARSYREAQSYITPLMFIVILPAMISSFAPGIDLTPALALIPIVNISLLSKKVMLGDYPPLEISLTFLSMILFVYLGLRFAVSIFEKEEVLLRISDDTQISWRNLFLPKIKSLRQLRPYPAPGQVFFLFFLELALFYYIAIPLQTRDIKSGTLISELALVLLPALLFSRGLSLSLNKTFNFRPAHPLAFLLAVTIGSSSWLMAYGIFWLQSKVISIPEAYIKLWEGISADFDKNLLYGILVVTLLPAICEELMFRGFVLNGLISRYQKWRGILLTGALFGAFHIDQYRILPTALVGIILSYLVVRSGSIYPAMIAHGIHNFSAFMAQKFFNSAGFFSASTSDPPLWLFAIGLAVFLTSIYFLSKKFTYMLSPEKS